MQSRSSFILRMAMAGAVAAALATVARAQTGSPAQTSPAPAAAPTADAPVKPWRIGPMDVSGFLDGYYSYNANGPSTDANGKVNDLYNFNDKTNQFNLSAAKLTLNHDPGLLGARMDFFYGRTSHLINTSKQLEFVEQAYLSTKPPAMKGFEADFGKFVTSAGAEVIEAKDNWNYSRSILFAWAIPYYHFGLRTSMPVSKTETLGVQLVRGWNNVTKPTGGVMTGITSGLVKTKYTLNADVYTGPENLGVQHGYRNLIDATLLLTPNSKFNAYINGDYGQHNNHHSSIEGTNDDKSKWGGIAFAARQQLTGKIAAAGRIEFFKDAQGYSTGVAQNLKEFTATGEYKTAWGLLGRLEYRHDWSDQSYFHKGNESMIDHQDTLTAGLIMVFAPKH
jgi:Putative beta-barrel porin-2, OmpL-like. bbp2